MNEREIFTAALEIEGASERSQYLDAACSGDPAFRQRVEALLAEHQKDDSFLLDSPPPGLGATLGRPPSTESPGTQIGPYKLLQQIGEGGMGVVWMAEQTQPVQRKVAIKVIKPGMDSRQVIARFEAERQALAMMDHVNIARVLDAGTTESGLPYFVMELVHGVPITKYCDDNHLTPRERLELFVPVCQAIQHAHQKGIIHRDIKPSNVMITLYDGKPVPKVIDFGVAKATEQTLTERTLFTQYGTMVGTLEYMSPEQAEMSALGVDTRSDIFSLGVLLYELLTGTTPLTHKRLKEAAYAEVLRLIKEEEPPKPSTRLTESGEAIASISAQRHMEPAKLTKLVRGELDWIVMKTLEKDRNRRYETASAFAADVQRYLKDEPVQACPPSAVYRFRKFARRNKAALVMASVVGMGVLLLIVALAVGIVLVNREKELVKDERDQKDQALQLADANLTQAHESVNRYFTIVSEDTLLDAPGLQPLRKQLLEAALKYYQGFLQQRSHDPKLQADVAVTYLRVSVIYNSLGENDEAVLALITGLETVDRLVREHPGDTELPKRFAGYFTSRRPFHSTGQAMKTDPRRVVQALQRSAELWEGFARDNPTTPGFRSDLIATYVLLGGGLANIDHDEALRTYRKASETAEKLVHENPAVPSYRERLAKVYYDLAGALKTLGRTHEAETTYRQAVECFEKASAEFPGEPDFRANLGISLKHLANFFAVCGRAKEAEDAFRRSVVLLDKVVNEFPNNVDYRDALSVSYDGLANCLVKDSGRLQEAEKVLRQALNIHEKLAGDFPHVPNYRRALASSYGILSGVLKKDRPEEAVQALRQKLFVREKVVIDYPTIERYRGELLETQEQLITLLSNAGQPQEVEKLYRQVVVRFEELAAANPNVPEYRTELARNHGRLGILLRTTGKELEAESELRKAQDLWRATSGPELERLKKAAEADPKNGLRWGDLAIASYRSGKWQDSLDIFKTKEHLGNGIGGSAWQWFYIAMAHWQLEHKEEAHYWYEQSIDWVETAQEKRLLAVQAEAAALMGLPDPSQRSERAWEYSQTGTDLEKQGQKDKANEAYGKAIDLYEKLMVDFPAVPAYRTKLVELLNKTGRGKDVERVDREAISSLEKLAAAHPKMALYRLWLVHSYQALANYLCYEVNQKAAAEKIYRESLLVRERLVADFPDNRDYQFHLAHGHLGLAFLFEATGRLPEAEKAYRQALVSFERVSAQSPNEPAYRVELATYLDRMGILLMTAKKFEEAEKTYRQAVAVWEKLANDLPADDWPRHELAYSHYLLGDLFKNTNRSQEAEQAYGKALALQEQLLAGTPTSASYRGRLALYHVNRGNVYATSSQWDKAVADYTKAIELKPDASEAWSGRAFVHFHRQQWDEAVADFSKAIDLAPQVHANLWHRGHAYLQFAQWDKAAADFGKVLEKWPDGAEGWYWRGLAFAQLNQPDKAVADLRQAITKGFNNVEQMKNDPKLAPLRTREDFGKLLEEMERQGKSKK